MNRGLHVAERAPLERPSVQLKLIRALAKGEKPAALARLHGVSTQAVTQFRDRHADRIAIQRANLDDVFASIEFADKGARIAELSKDAADIAAMLADPDLRATVGYAETARVKQSALRAIAEELGQLPSRMQVQVGGQLDVNVGGIDVSQLAKDLT